MLHLHRHPAQEEPRRLVYALLIKALLLAQGKDQTAHLAHWLDILLRRVERHLNNRSMLTLTALCWLCAGWLY